MKSASNTTPLQAIQRLTRAWKRKDAAEMSRWLADDIVEIGPTFTRAIEGQASFFRQYQDYLTGPLRILSYRILRPQTLHLHARLALVCFHYRMRTSTEGVVEESRGKESMLVERTRGRWRVRFIHWHRDPDPPAG